MHEVVSQLWSDAHESPLLTVLVLVPTLFSIPLIVRGSALAWVAPGILVLQVGADFWYVASAAANPGLGAAMQLVLWPWLVGMAATVAAYISTARRPRGAHLR